MQSSPNSRALCSFYASELLTQVPETPMKSIKYMDKEIINLKKDLMRSRPQTRHVLPSPPSSGSSSFSTVHLHLHP
uniref:Coiled-coil domain containing 60 n=1 Tax=Rousettus aegyptiacus TaxID=9407 RepID=A0A7J8GWF4_ROUAE|nr:coiled-coil domain containing 60 [Rousettus aegyptiacus]